MTDKKETIIVNSTKNYDMFKTLLGNRIFNPNLLIELKKSFKRKNLFPYRPILVNEKMEVIDGQHRLNIAKELKIPVYYNILPGGNLEDVRLLNSGMRRWSYRNYLESYVDLKVESYQVLANFIKKYQLPISISVLILEDMEDTISADGNLINRFKDGEFQVKDLEKAEEFANTLNHIGMYMEGVFWRTRDFIAAYAFLYNNVDVEVFIRNLATSEFKLRRRPNVNEYLRDFSEIFNWKKRTNSIDLVKLRKGKK